MEIINLPNDLLPSILTFSHKDSELSLINKFFSDKIHSKRSNKYYNFTVNIKTLTNSSIYFSHTFTFYDTILDFKKGIIEKYPEKYKYVNNIRLVCCGKLLKNDDLLVQHYKNFPRIACLHLIYYDKDVLNTLIGFKSSRPQFQDK